MLRRIVFSSLLFASLSFSQDFLGLLSISVPAVSVRSGEAGSELFVNGSPAFEYDYLVVDKLSVFGFATLSAYPVGGRTGLSLGGGGGMRFWAMEGFSGLFFGSFGGVEVIDTGKTQTWLRLGLEAGFRYPIEETLSLIFGRTGSVCGKWSRKARTVCKDRGGLWILK